MQRHARIQAMLWQVLISAVAAVVAHVAQLALGSRVWIRIPFHQTVETWIWESGYLTVARVIGKIWSMLPMWLVAFIAAALLAAWRPRHWQKGCYLFACFYILAQIPRYMINPRVRFPDIGLIGWYGVAALFAMAGGCVGWNLRCRGVADEIDGPTCLDCGFNLTGNKSGMCPECGERL